MLKQSVFPPLRPPRAATPLSPCAIRDWGDTHGAQALTRGAASFLKFRMAIQRIQFVVPLAQHRSAR
jgi:hypothetical protein